MSDVMDVVTHEFRFAPEGFLSIPRMFPSLGSMLLEIFQNVYRAGAENVVVIYDSKQNLLTIKDDGPGIESPRVLLDAGSSKWVGDVVEPAGMGAFAVLSEKYVKNVVYTSIHRGGAWRMELSPNMLTGGRPAQENVSKNGDPCGLRLEIFLKDGVSVGKNDVTTARALYPYNVTFISDDNDFLDIPPANHWDMFGVVDTPVGRVGFRDTKYSVASSKAYAVWEHRPLCSSFLSDALSKAADRHQYRELAKFIVGQSLLWHIDPSCGVRPRLPDRSELSQDDYLDIAAKLIVDAIVAHYYEMVRASAADFPDRILSGKVWQLEHMVFENQQLHSRKILEALLPSLGWSRVHEIDYKSIDVYYVEENGFEIDCFPTGGWDKTVPKIAEPHLSISLVNQDRWVSLDPKAPKRKITFHGLRIGDAHPPTEYEVIRGCPPCPISPYIAICDRIEVEGFGDLPYLVSPDIWDEGTSWCHPELDNAGVVIVYAGSPADLSKALGEDLRFVHAILGSHHDFASDALYDTWWNWHLDELDYDKIIEDLRLQITEAFAPDLLQSRKCFYAMYDLAEWLSASKSKLIMPINRSKEIGWRSRLWRPFFRVMRWLMTKAYKVASLQLAEMKVAAEL